MTTHTATLQVNHTTQSGVVFLNGEQIGVCPVSTRYNHCFEFDYFNMAYPIIEKAFLNKTGMSISMGGTLQLHRVDYKLNYK